MKYYRVVKDHPAWEVGAILQENQGKNGYEPLSDVWDKFGYVYGLVEAREVVENSDFFERVYDVGNLGRAAYVVKSEAVKLYNKVYNGSDK